MRTTTHTNIVAFHKAIQEAHKELLGFYRFNWNEINGQFRSGIQTPALLLESHSAQLNANGNNTTTFNDRNISFLLLDFTGKADNYSRQEEVLDTLENVGLDIASYLNQQRVLIGVEKTRALMNGQGVVDVIHSCCPSIKNAWATPSVDLDAIFIAIRIASYGSSMDIDSVCPHCGEENRHAVDLTLLLDKIQAPEYTPVEIDNLVFEFKPQSFKNYNDANLVSYEQQKLIATITNSTLTDEEKVQQFNTIFPRLTDMNVSNMINNIQAQAMPQLPLAPENADGNQVDSKSD